MAAMLTSIMASAFGPVVLVLLGYLVLWGLIGLILWLKPNLWDISESARHSPHLPEEDMLLWRRRR